jgi:colicin import membrane protein
MAIATMPMHLAHLERDEPGVQSSAVLALLVHVLLFTVLFFGVRWQSRPPETVSVELWSPPPPPVVERVEVKPEPVTAPAPPKPEPVIEVPKPDIVIKAKPEPKPKPEPVKPKHEPPPPKPHPKPEAVKPKPEPVKPVPAKPRDDDIRKQLREELAKEQKALQLNRESQNIKDQLAQEMAAAQKNALSGYGDKIRAKVRGNIVMPPEIKGNPEAVFVVIQLPTGEVLSTKLRKSSGNAAYDTAVERAILKSSPLPKPDKGELFMRELTLTFHPHD